MRVDRWSSLSGRLLASGGPGRPADSGDGAARSARLGRSSPAGSGWSALPRAHGLKPSRDSDGERSPPAARQPKARRGPRRTAAERSRSYTRVRAPAQSVFSWKTLRSREDGAKPPRRAGVRSGPADPRPRPSRAPRPNGTLPAVPPAVPPPQRGHAPGRHPSPLPRPRTLAGRRPDLTSEFWGLRLSTPRGQHPPSPSGRHLPAVAARAPRLSAPRPPRAQHEGLRLRRGAAGPPPHGSPPRPAADHAPAGAGIPPGRGPSSVGRSSSCIGAGPGRTELVLRARVSLGEERGSKRREPWPSSARDSTFLQTRGIAFYF